MKNIKDLTDILDRIESNLYEYDASNPEQFFETVSDCIKQYKELKDKPVFFLFGVDAVTTYENEGIDVLITEIQTNDLGYAIYEYSGDIMEFVSEHNGWNDCTNISEEDYNKLAEL